MNEVVSLPVAAGATYVYGVAAAESFANGHGPVNVPGIGGASANAPVRTIAFKDLVAVVSDVPSFQFDLTREHLLEHQHVLDEVLTRSDVLPFSFGTVAGSDEEVRALLLERGFDALHEQLDYVRGCVELDLKVFWDRERLFAEIAEENGEVRALRDAIATLPEDEAAAAKLTLGQIIEAEIELKTAWEAERLLTSLEHYAVDVEVSPNLNDMMLLNAAFLVERAREVEFDSAVFGAGDAQKDRFAFHYVGPLPPYSFINLAFEAEE